MSIYLHNPSHNGDQILTLGIVRKIIEQNTDKKFTIVPACSMYLLSKYIFAFKLIYVLISIYTYLNTIRI